MSFGYKIIEPTGKATIVAAEDRFDARKRVCGMQEKWEEYCDRNWLNDTGDLFSPELKVKRFLDSLAYFYLIGDTSGIETDYKKVMHAKREIPVSNCPTEIENMIYASGSVSDLVNKEEYAAFQIILDRLDLNAEKYDSQKHKKKLTKSLFRKYNKLGIHGGEWCRVDTDWEFSYDGQRYKIDSSESQYDFENTEFGEYYAMDKVLVSGGKFYDMNYDEIKVYKVE